MSYRLVGPTLATIFSKSTYNSMAVMCCWYYLYVLNIICMSLLLLILNGQNCMLLLMFEIGHIYLILTTLFWMPIFMLWQNLIFSSSNDMVWEIKKYVDLSDINIGPCSVFVIIKPLKYTITVIFILLSMIFSHFFTLALTLKRKQYIKKE